MSNNTKLTVMLISFAILCIGIAGLKGIIAIPAAFYTFMTWMYWITGIFVLIAGTLITIFHKVIIKKSSPEKAEKLYINSATAMHPMFLIPTITNSALAVVMFLLLGSPMLAALIVINFGIAATMQHRIKNHFERP